MAMRRLPAGSAAVTVNLNIAVAATVAATFAISAAVNRAVSANHVIVTAAVAGITFIVTIFDGAAACRLPCQRSGSRWLAACPLTPAEPPLALLAGP